MAKYLSLLKALFHEGRTEGLFALARLGGDPLSLDMAGLNLVTASVPAALPQADKLVLARRVGDLVRLKPGAQAVLLKNK